MIGGVYAKHVDAIGHTSPPFPQSTTQWIDVVDSHLESHPRNRSCTWSLWHPVTGKRKILGIDIPLLERIGALGAAHGTTLDLRLLAPRTEYFDRYEEVPENVIEYEKIQYARAVAHWTKKAVLLGTPNSTLVWPLWDADDEDPINGEPLGATTEQREQTDTSSPSFGPSAVPPQDDNDIRNLIGFRNKQGHIRVGNVYALLKFLEEAVTPPEDNPYLFGDPDDGVIHLDRYNVREPLLHNRVHNPIALIELLKGWRSHPPLVIINIDVDPLVVDSRYAHAFADESTLANEQIASLKVKPREKRKRPEDVSMFLKHWLYLLQRVGTNTSLSGQDDSYATKGRHTKGKLLSIEDVIEALKKDKSFYKETAEVIEAKLRVRYADMTNLTLSEQLRKLIKENPDESYWDWKGGVSKLREANASEPEREEYRKLVLRVKTAYDAALTDTRRARVILPAPDIPGARFLRPEREPFPEYKARLRALDAEYAASANAAANSLAARMRMMSMRR